MTNIAFLGAGNIASAIIGGLIQDTSAENIIAADPSSTCRDAVNQLGVATTDSNNEAVSQGDIIVLCVKPNIVPRLLSELKADLDGKLIISVVAGITIETIRNQTAGRAAIIRCMPNTPALVRAGMTAMYAGEDVNKEQRKTAQKILEAVGETLWVANESELDAVTAVSGSGPAYFFFLMEAMINAGVSEGLSPDISRRLVLQTALGAARIALENETDPADLRHQVTSPGGTTQAAIEEFSRGGFQDLVSKAIAAARQRSIELSQQS
jgi:pyrroline-5-carboxylate reductase